MKCGLFRRFLAYLIDGIIIGAIMRMLVNLGIGTNVDISNLGGMFRNQTFPALLAAAVYFLLFAYFNQGKTVGKMVFRMEVESLDGGELDQNRMLLREGVKVLLLPLSIISLITCLFTGNNLALHDIIMNSIVLKKV